MPNLVAVEIYALLRFDEYFYISAYCWKYSFQDGSDALQLKFSYI